MRELGHIDGVGFIGSAEATYSIRVIYDGDRIQGHGALLTSDTAALAAFEAFNSVLTLETGEKIKVIVKGFTRGSPTPFMTNDILPGPWAEMIGE